MFIFKSKEIELRVLCFFQIVRNIVNTFLFFFHFYMNIYPFICKYAYPIFLIGKRKLNIFCINYTSIAHWITNPLWKTSEHNHKYNCQHEFLIFSPENICSLFFINFKSFLKINTGSTYSDRFWCDSYNTIIRIYRITKHWK